VVEGYAKGRAKRAELIERATTLFGEAGYRGASLREIAARCGISHAGLLHHFPSKEALLTAVLAHRDDADAGFVDPAGDPVQVLKGFVDLAAANAARRGIVELYTVLAAEATAVDHPAHDHFVRRYERVVGMAGETFRRAQAAGLLRDGVDPAVAARSLVALMDGLQVQWLLADGELDMAAAVRDHLALLVV
jgi:AcrR family transcriptional regulator